MLSLKLVQEEKGGESKMDKYICKACRYVYDPEKGDKSSGIPPGTAFEDLPDTWVCPRCGFSKDKFEKVTQGLINYCMNIDL